MILELMLASTCVAKATTHIRELKTDFESRACLQEDIIKAELKGDKSKLEIVMTLSLDRTTLAPDPLRATHAGNIAEAVLAYVQKTFKYFPDTFVWTVNDENDKYICTIRIEEGTEISGDCGGAGKK